MATKTRRRGVAPESADEFVGEQPDAISADATQVANEYAALARDEILWIPRSLIDPDPEQVRTQFRGIEELRELILAEGLKEILKVRPHPAQPDRFMLVSGERRWRATEGIEQVREGAPAGCLPCVLSLDEEDEADRLVSEFLSNTGMPLTPIEEARLFKRLMEQHGLSQVAVAKRLGVPRSTVGDRVRIFEIPAPWFELVEDETLSVSHVPSIHRFKDADAKLHAKFAKEARSMVDGLRARGEEMPVGPFGSMLGDWFAGEEWKTRQRDAAAQARSEVNQSDEDVEEDRNYEAKDADGLTPEIQRAHNYALLIESSDNRDSKQAKKLRKELHAMPFWEAYRFAEPNPALKNLSGFDAFEEYHRRRLTFASSSNSAQQERAFDEKVGVPTITHALWRQAPEWFRAAHLSQASNVKSTVAFQVSVEGGDLLGAAWGKGKEEQLKKLKTQLREQRREVIASRIAFGEKENLAEGAVDRFIATVRAEEEAQQAKHLAKAAAERQEREAAWAERKRPNREHDDKELLDAIATHDLHVSSIGDDHWQAYARGRGFEGESPREAIAVALEAVEARLVDVLATGDADAEDGGWVGHAANDDLWDSEDDEANELTPRDTSESPVAPESDGQPAESGSAAVEG